MRERQAEAGQASEHASLLDLATTLWAGPASDATLAAALDVVLGELQLERWALFVRAEDGGMELRVSRGLAAGAPAALDAGTLRGDVVPVALGDLAHDRHGLVMLVPVHRRDRPIAVLGVGRREGQQPFGPTEQALLKRVAACLAPSIEGGLLYEELRGAHLKLSQKAFELHNLVDISRELATSSAEDAIQSLVATTAMGHFVVSRCALYLLGPRGLALAHGRGLRRGIDGAPIPLDELRPALEALAAPRAVAELPDGALRRQLTEARLVLAVPMVGAGAKLEGLLAIGERASGMPFSEEDRAIAQTLARQATGALENARLLRVREDKLRQDRELQLAREIQRSLFPSRAPELAGFEVAGASRPCFEVGGDAYDWIALANGGLALLIADVSGKGTPASLLMASVHAYVHALAGTMPPLELVGRLNRFLFARTLTSRFVTLFYAELDPASRRLTYINAGHVPPYRLAAGDAVSRLGTGGPALGLIDDARFEPGEVTLDPGNWVVMVTDGVTEAAVLDDREFGDDRVSEALRRAQGGAEAVLAGLVAAVEEWAGPQGLGDDLTALVLKAR